ncbi:MAG: hypothetical protein RL494_1232 [Bacteroidota bacterium]|jgi:hypothetical protein
MKKLFVVALLFVGLTNFAQEKKGIVERGERAEMEQLTPEQRNVLQLKKMTLDLNLTASQQKQLEPIIAEETNKREAKKTEMKARKETKKTLTANEKFELKNKNLDEQIELKAKMRKILTDDQMKKWEMKKEKRDVNMRKIKKNQIQKQKTKTEVSE